VVVNEAVATLSLGSPESTLDMAFFESKFRAA
jgi:hypothetical protein